MSRTRRAVACALALTAGWCAEAARAQFSGPEQFVVSPYSGIAAGPGVDLLQTSTTAAGFTVAGTYSVPVAAAPANGLVARWAVERPLALNLNLSFQSLTLLIGSSAPPAGTC